MKLVLDTNVIISALIARGVCKDLFEQCMFSHEILISEFILAELRGHLHRKFNLSDRDINETLVFFRSRMKVVIPQTLPQPVCRDPDDDQIIGTALAGNAEYVVTGDKDLLVLQNFQGIKIVSPRDFLDLHPGIPHYHQ